MIVFNRGSERRRTANKGAEVWHSLGAEPSGPLAAVDEYRLPPCARLPRHGHENAEVLTFVRHGGLAYEDSNGCSGVIMSGELHRSTGAYGMRQNARNASRSVWTHVFQICLVPSPRAMEPGSKQRLFSTAERNGMLRVIASPDGREDSIGVSADVVMHSAILEAGYHLIHALGAARGAWLQVANGSLTLDDAFLVAGDSASIANERAVAVTARQTTEVILFDYPLDGG